ncbi:MAG: exodeoxyribonuclease VII small subunit [Bacteroidales bacterium]|nr:exodeoxyribonuclease VII small subunit [Bacteroidales bacterium]
MKRSEYAAAVKKVEEIIRKVEDPGTGIEESERLIAEAGKLLDECSACLRTEMDSIKEKE